MLVKAWRIIVAAIVFMIISQVIHTIESWFTLSYYMDDTYSQVWSKIMMPTAGPPPIEFYYYSLTFAFIGGLIFAWVYSFIEKSISSKSLLNKGLIYGLLIWLIGGLSGSLGMVLLVNLPIELIAYWTVTGLIINLLAGIATAKIVK